MTSVNPLLSTQKEAEHRDPPLKWTGSFSQTETLLQQSKCKTSPNKSPTYHTRQRLQQGRYQNLCFGMRERALSSKKGAPSENHNKRSINGRSKLPQSKNQRYSMGPLSSAMFWPFCTNFDNDLSNKDSKITISKDEKQNQNASP